MQLNKLGGYVARCLTAGAVAAVAVSLLMVEPAAAQYGGGSKGGSQQSDQDRKSESKTRKSYVIQDAKLAKVLQEVVELMEVEKYTEALSAMRGVPALDKLSSYERAKVHQIYGSLYASQGQYKDALVAFEKMLREPDLPDSERSQATYNLSQLYLAEGRFDEAIGLLQRWFQTAVNPSPDAYFLLCQAYIQVEKYSDALKPCQTTINVAQERGLELKESWYRAMVVVYQQSNDIVNAESWMRRLLVTFPKRDYWLQEVAMLSQLGKEQEEFAAYNLAYRQGLLRSESEWMRLANLYQYHGVPYKAGVVLEEKIKQGVVKPDRRSLELLANSYTLAKEFDKAVQPLARAAALANESHLWERLAQVYIEREEWAKASDALDKAIAAGDLKDPYRTRVLAGITLVNGNKFAEARSSFESARRFANNDRERKSIDAWLRFVQDEQRRYNDIREYKVKRYAAR